MSEESLAHFGILGQKWGVRRYQNEDRTYTEEGKLRYAKNHDGEDRREWKAKDAKDLSDKELRDRIARLQLEKTYTQLFEAPKVQNNGFQKPQKQKNKGGGIMKKIFFATAVTALSTVIQGKYQDFFKAKADKFIDSFKRNKTAADNAAKAAKTIKDTAVASNAWDTYRKFAKHSDEDGYSFLDMKVDDLFLDHHGIKGQKWGVRRYQNEDGSLTEEGKKRYQKENFEKAKQVFIDNQGKTGYENSFAVKGRVILPKDRMDEIIELKKEYDNKYLERYKEVGEAIENDKVMYDEYYKPGGLSEKVDGLIKDLLGDYAGRPGIFKDRISLRSMRQLIQWSASDAIDNPKIRDEFKGTDLNKPKDSVTKENKSNKDPKWNIKDLTSRDNASLRKDFKDSVEAKQGKLLDKFWSEKFELKKNIGSYDDLEKLQMKYAKQLAKELNLPASQSTYNFLIDEFLWLDD